MIQILILITLISAPLCLAMGFVITGNIYLAVICSLIGALQLLAFQKQWLRSGFLFLAYIVVFSSAGAYFEINKLLLGASILMGLDAWDLIRFDRRLSAVSLVADPTRTTQDHLRKLGRMNLLSVGVYLPVQFIRINIGFWWLIFLALAVVYSISFLVQRLRIDQDHSE
jgi:hypothetical protein